MQWLALILAIGNVSAQTVTVKHAVVPMSSVKAVWTPTKYKKVTCEAGVAKLNLSSTDGIAVTLKQFDPSKILGSPATYIDTEIAFCTAGNSCEVIGELSFGRNTYAADDTVKLVIPLKRVGCELAAADSIDSAYLQIFMRNQTILWPVVPMRYLAKLNFPLSTLHTPGAEQPIVNAKTGALAGIASIQVEPLVLTQ